MVAVYFINSSAVQTAEGLITKTSSHSVKETMDRFKKIITDKGLNVAARVNHTAAAIKSDTTLRPTELPIFG